MSFDKAGNFTWDGQYKLSYDPWNRLTSVARGDAVLSRALRGWARLADPTGDLLSLLFLKT